MNLYNKQNEVIIMNKIIKTTFVLGMAVLMVTGCDFIQYKQVDYDEWHEKVSNLPESPTPTKVLVKGKADGKVIDIVIKEGNDYSDLSEEEVAVVLVIGLMSGGALANIEEKANAKYYVGQLFKEGFKLEDEDDDGKHVVTWDKYGNMTSYDAEDINFTAKYTFEEE